MNEYVVRVRRTASWAAVVLVLLIVALVVANVHAPAASNGASVVLSLKVVPTVRSVTVTPGRSSFGTCTGGSVSGDTVSTSAELGYPNARCWDGRPGAARLPVTVTYSGPPGRVLIAGSDAAPATGFTGWRLCKSAFSCSGRHGLPGLDQYMVRNFGSGSTTSGVLTDSLRCDQQFGPGGCTAAPGQSQKEGFELIGPAASANTSPLWTVTITWAAAPPGS